LGTRPRANPVKTQTNMAIYLIIHEAHPRSRITTSIRGLTE